MVVVAGIDEAGYGPLFGPLVLSATVLELPGDSPEPRAPNPLAAIPDAWGVLKAAVSQQPGRGRSLGERIAVNDSKKLLRRGSAQPLLHLERGVLSFAMQIERFRQASIVQSDHQPETLSPPEPDDGPGSLSLPTLLGLLLGPDVPPPTHLPWYAPSAEQPWPTLPRALELASLRIDAAALRRALKQQGGRVLAMGSEVLDEDRFNRELARTPNKAAVCFGAVCRLLRRIWNRFGAVGPIVAVDRLSGRADYRPTLSRAFPEARLTNLTRGEGLSCYTLESGQRSMMVGFQVNADGLHLSTALASMTSKYVRELLMERFQAYFQRRLPRVRPTAGYGADAVRFWRELEPELPRLGLDPDRLKRRA